MIRFLHERSGAGGNAMLIAVLVTSVCMSAVVVGVQLAVVASRSSGVDRQRVLAVNAAEAGIDSGYTAIQAAGTNLPCSLSSGDVHSAPDTASYSGTVTYYDAAGVVMACPLAGAVPAQAVIRSTATTNTLGGSGSRPTRVMEALINLAPVSGTGLDKVIFANGLLDASVAVSTVGNAGANADIYSNNNINCGVAMNVAGSVYSQGDISGNTSCNVAGNVWAKGNANMSGVSTVVSGFAKAGTGAVNIGIGGVVTGNLYAGGSITYSGCLAGRCFPNASPGPPPVQAFPIIRSDAATMAAWTAPAPGPGYTLYDDNVNCGTLWSRIRDTYAKTGTPTLLRTTCAISFPVAATVVLGNDLAIFGKAGFYAGVAAAFSTNSAVTRKLHWIVPYDAAAALPCTSPSISTDVSFAVSSTIAMFTYSPCDMSFNVAGTMTGQVYGGSKVTPSVAYTIRYQSVPTYGIDPLSVPPLGYTASVVYKRENR